MDRRSQIEHARKHVHNCEQLAAKARRTLEEAKSEGADSPSLQKTFISALDLLSIARRNLELLESRHEEL
jgi:hypothetical protein